MKHGVYSAMIGLIGLLVCTTALSTRAKAPAAPKPPAASTDSFEVVVKYGGATGKANTPTGIHMVFTAEALPSGDVGTFLVKNANETVKKYGPDPKVAQALKQFKAGDLIDIIFTMPQNSTEPIPVQSLKAYKLKVGEDDPNGYVFVEYFVRKVGEQSISEITLSKYTQKTTYKVPTHLDTDGTLVADDAIVAIAGKLHAGQVVYAMHTGNGADAAIKLLAPWANHFTGKFVQLDPSTTVDANNDPGPAVELVGPKGKPVTALIAGIIVGKKWTPDPAILEAVKSLKPDANVDYITANSGDKRIWLVSIKPSKPAPTTMASGMQ